MVFIVVMILKGDRPASYSHEEETTNAETKENRNTINKFHLQIYYLFKNRDTKSSREALGRAAFICMGRRRG